MRQQKIRVLHILKSMDIGGIETYIMNMYKNIDSNKYSFDFLLWENHKSFYEDEIREMGGNIHKFKFAKNPIINIIRFIKFLNINNYDVLHCHTLFYSGFFALANFIKNRKNNIFISHVHSKSDNHSNNIVRKIYKKITRLLILKYSTYYCACSKEAGDYVFGINKKIIILKDYINTNDYLYPNKTNVNKIKNKYKLINNLILGNVGRLSVEKNQVFIIKLVKYLTRKNYNIKCLFIGDGPERKKLERITMDNNLNKNIIFVGNVSNVNEYLNCMDIFLFPSLYEGFGMALLEAQASGINCISSSEVPKLTDMNLNLVSYLPLNDIELWANAIIDICNKRTKLKKQIIKKQIIKNGFDVSNSITLIEKIYGGDYNE